MKWQVTVDVGSASVLEGDALDVLRTLDAESVQCCVTSPPYWGLRDYGHADQYGLEATPEEYVAKMVAVFAEVRRVLRDDGTLWLNIGDSYASSTRGSGSKSEKQISNAGSLFAEVRRWRVPVGIKPKDLVGIPWMLAFALRADGWYLRQEIIWHKPSPMPESVRDRMTKAHESLFLLSKNERYFFDAEANQEPAGARAPGNRTHKTAARYADGAVEPRTAPSAIGARETRNRRDVWTIATKSFKGAHFAVMPEALVDPCVLIGSAPGDLVLDPFCGSGTVGVVALKRGRRFVGVELNPEYAAMARVRIAAASGARK